MKVSKKITYDNIEELASVALNVRGDWTQHPPIRSRVASKWFCFMPRNVDGQHLVLMHVHECRQGFQTTSCAQAQGQAT